MTSNFYNIPLFKFVVLMFVLVINYRSDYQVKSLAHVVGLEQLFTNIAVKVLDISFLNLLDFFRSDCVFQHVLHWGLKHESVSMLFYRHQKLCFFSEDCSNICFRFYRFTMLFLTHKVLLLKDFEVFSR